MEETGAALPVKDLFAGIQKMALKKVYPPVTYREACCTKYTSYFFRFDGTQGKDRRYPIALKTAFKIQAVTSHTLNPTEILLVKTKIKTFASLSKIIQLTFFTCSNQLTLCFLKEHFGDSCEMFFRNVVVWVF